MDPQRLHEIVERQAQRRPDEVAVVDGERTISYGELQQLSWQLAHVLQSSGLRSQDRVALWLDKSIEAIVGMLGTLAAGGVYVPLDPASPASRVRKVLVSCEPA
ncbi:MAG: AMP-binding protein, partial [Acidobacteriota bacterium]